MPNPRKVSRSHIIGYGDARLPADGNHAGGEATLPRSVDYTGDAQQDATEPQSPQGRSGWKDADGTTQSGYEH